MAWSKIGYGTPAYKEYEAMDHKLLDYASAYSFNEYEDVILTAMEISTKYRRELQEVYEGYWSGKYNIEQLREHITVYLHRSMLIIKCNAMLVIVNVG